MVNYSKNPDNYQAPGGEFSVKKRISILLNIFISVFVPYAWLKMMLSAGGLLSSSGWGAIKYFTVQSNLFMGATSLLALVIMLTGKSVPRWASRLKYIATVAVALTFTAVVAFLGHVYGYKMMFSGANLWLHRYSRLCIFLRCAAA